MAVGHHRWPIARRSALGVAAHRLGDTAECVQMKPVKLQPVQQVKRHRPVVAVGYKAPDETIVVTDVLCMNFPDMTNDELAALSFKLDEWSRHHQRR
jgi:hypothetical protein